MQSYYFLKVSKVKKNEVNVLHDQCSKLSECEDLKNDSLEKGCGYCGATKKFLMGNSEGPFDDVCLEGWAFNAQICNKNKEKNVCSTIKNCFEIQNNMTNRNCGWCPAKNKAFVYKNLLSHENLKSVPRQRGTRSFFRRSAPMQRGARFCIFSRFFWCPM